MTSKYELIVTDILEKNYISFITEKMFNGCKYKYPLRFDFFLTDNNICIELDGQQHYEPQRFGGITEDEAIDNFNEQRIKDEIKNEFCKSENIKLVRIPYFKFDEIETILKDTIL